MKRPILSILFILLFSACSTAPQKTNESIVDHELMEELCFLEKQYARQYENKSEAQIKEICEI